MKRTAEAKLNQFFAGSLPVRLHLRSDLHLLRKVWHMTMGMTVALIYYSGMSRSSAVVILGAILGTDLLLESLRLRIPSVNDKILRLWGPIMRNCEVNRMSGVPHYLASAILAIGIFPKPVAILSILYLACGDPIASLFGVLYGKHGIRMSSGKSLIGTTAGVLTCMLVTIIFLKSLGLSNDVIWTLSLVGGLAGGTAELLPLEMDDNFTIPVVSGFALWLAFIVLGV